MVSRFGGPEVVEVRTDWPEPRLGHADVLVAVAGSGVNPADVKIRRGNREVPRLPYVPGREAAGTVLAVGAGVDALQPGDRVFSYFQWSGTPGGLAERLVLPAHLVARAPDTLDLVESATLPLAGSTALQALRALQAEPGDVLAVVGASGGVGTYAVQLAACAGVRVIALAGASSVDLLDGLGADVVIDYRDASALDQLHRATHLLDLVGESSAARYTCHLRPDVRAVTTTKAWRFASREVAYVRAQSLVADLDVLAHRVDDGELRPVIANRFGLDDASEAHRRVESGGVHGKVVVEI